jgi:hypothetical protein
MRQSYAIVLLLFWLAACSGPAEVAAPTQAQASPTAEVTPTVARPTIPAAATILPPTSAPTAPPPTVAPPSNDLQAGIAPLPGAALDVQAQANALLPNFAGDLARAGEWNRYTISAAIDPEARSIGGRLRLEYTNRDFVSLDRLYFHLYPNLPDFGGNLAVSAVQIESASADPIFESGRYLLRLNLPRPLDPGATTTIALDWRASAPANASRELYGAFNREIGVLSLASAFPIVAIVRGGNWDIGTPDPKGDFVNSETALYDVTLAAPAGWILAATGVEIDRHQDGDQQIARLVSGPQRDFMITLSQFAQASAEVEGTRINSYYRAEHEAGGRKALQAAANALRVFNKRYGPYPLAELDVVEIAASTFLGVEYPGLIEIEQNLYTSGNGLEVTVAHEVSHQWWYSVVGDDVQTTSWLDEALASYSQIIYQEEINGPEAAERELDEFRRRYRDIVAAGRDAPVEQPNSKFVRNYVALVYGKAVLFLQAVRNQIGEAAFDRFLHDHYAKHRYDYIGSADLLADAEGACGCNLHPLFTDWITKVAPVVVP